MSRISGRREAGRRGSEEAGKEGASNHMAATGPRPGVEMWGVRSEKRKEGTRSIPVIPPIISRSSPVGCLHLVS